MTQPQESSRPGPVGSGLTLDHESDRFLAAHPDLRPLVHETLDKAAAYFPAAEQRLEIVRDPEDGSETLVLFLRTSEHWETGDERYERFAEDWWLDQVPQTGARFTVTMDYV